MSQWKKILYPLLILLIALLLDGALTAQLKGVFSTSIGTIIPHLTLLVLMILSFYLSFRHSIILSLLLGFIYDSYFTGYLGIYMAAFTLIIYMILQFRKYIQPNLIIYTLLSIIMITLLEFFVFGVYKAINITNMSTEMFMVNRLGATLLFNSLVMLVLSYPLDRLAQMIVQKEEIRFRK